MTSYSFPWLLVAEVHLTLQYFTIIQGMRIWCTHHDAFFPLAAVATFLPIAPFKPEKRPRDFAATLGSFSCDSVSVILGCVVIGCDRSWSCVDLMVSTSTLGCDERSAKGSERVHDFGGRGGFAALPLLAGACVRWKWTKKKGSMLVSHSTWHTANDIPYSPTY